MQLIYIAEVRLLLFIFIAFEDYLIILKCDDDILRSSDIHLLKDQSPSCTSKSAWGLTCTFCHLLFYCGGASGFAFIHSPSTVIDKRPVSLPPWLVVKGCRKLAVVPAEPSRWH